MNEDAYRDNQLNEFLDNGVRNDRITVSDTHIITIFDTVDNIEDVDEARLSAKLHREGVDRRSAAAIELYQSNQAKENTLADMLEYEAQNRGHYA